MMIPETRLAPNSREPPSNSVTPQPAAGEIEHQSDLSARGEHGHCAGDDRSPVDGSSFRVLIDLERTRSAGCEAKRSCT